MIYGDTKYVHSAIGHVDILDVIVDICETEKLYGTIFLMALMSQHHRAILPAIDAGNYFWARDDPETLLPIGYESISEWVESFAKAHLQDSHSNFTLRLFFVQHGAACLYLNDMKPIFETTYGIRQAKLP
ncbi:hypothetical protein QFC20_007413 [Naganishia adeliensis]|uniref:Uncharacterized protein n=1 Tax=Naganishia adeliensis TaxID=92952 RepID=A0ACC2UZJ0_9TREE|nr:hypothetical protein QFC20_007413 [Naganishia adeliensis]